MPGALGHGIEVCADHNNTVVPASRRLGQYVKGLEGSAEHVGDYVHLEVWRVGPLLAEREGRPEDRNATHVVGRQGAIDQPLAGRRVTLVEDDHADGARGGSVLGLELVVAGAALYQGDVAGQEAYEVVCLAAAVGHPVAGQVEVDRSHEAGDVARIGL